MPNTEIFPHFAQLLSSPTTLEDTKKVTKKIKGVVPYEIAGVGRPKEAKLQLALLPSMTGVGSTHAFLADSGSRNVTCLL